MPHQIISADPFVLEDPSLVLNYDATVGTPIAGQTEGLQLNCALSTIAYGIQYTDVNQGTFCAPGAKRKKANTRTLTATVRQSFGAAGLFNLLLPLFDEAVNFAMLGDFNLPVGLDNWEMSGRVYVPELPVYSGDQDPSEAMTFDIELELQGKPTYANTVGGAVTTHPV